jgi:hypothetical protein
VPLKPVSTRAQLPNRHLGEDNPFVPDTSQSAATPARDPFRSGAIVITTLANPREKFWGAILNLSAEGLSLCGIELASFDDLVAMVKDAEPFSASVVFFPMHRVERMELDLPEAGLPSLAQRFAAKTGIEPDALFHPSAVSPFPVRQERP